MQQYNRTRASARARTGARARPQTSPITHEHPVEEEEGEGEEEEEEENDNVIVRLYERAEQDKAMVAQLRGDLAEAEERLEAFKVLRLPRRKMTSQPNPT